MADTDQSVVEELVGNAHGNLARVRELLDVHPAALNLRAPVGAKETAIEAATQMGNKPIIELLIARGAPVDFFTACVLGRIDDVKAELAGDPSRVNARGVRSSGALLCRDRRRAGNSEALTGSGADVNARSESAAPIHGAVMGGAIDGAPAAGARRRSIAARLQRSRRPPACRRDGTPRPRRVISSVLGSFRQALRHFRMRDWRVLVPAAWTQDDQHHQQSRCDARGGDAERELIAAGRALESA